MDEPLATHVQIAHSDLVPTWEDKPVVQNEVFVNLEEVKGLANEITMTTDISQECLICFEEFKTRF